MKENKVNLSQPYGRDIFSPRFVGSEIPPKRKEIRSHSRAYARDISRRGIKILVTGGHVTPALATIEELRKQKPDTDIVFVGREYALEGVRFVSEESRVIRELGIRFIPIQTGRLSRTLSVQSVFSILRIPWGLLQALWIVAREKPTLIVSFGGYIAVPVVIAGRLVGIPSVTHEQTRKIGIANTVISRLAKKVFVSFEDQVDLFPQGKAVYSGLPMRSVVFHPPNKPSFTLPTDKPLLFISGGATGAMSINDLFYPIIPDLCKKFCIVHQTGKPGLHKAQAIQALLGSTEKERYIPLAYLNGQDYSWVMHHVDILVGRSGANTVGEAAFIGVIAIWIPLPWSGGGEQQANARHLEKQGTSRVLEQIGLTPQVLMKTIDETANNREVMRKNAREYARKQTHTGAQLLAQHIYTLCTPRTRS